MQQNVVIVEGKDRELEEKDAELGRKINEIS